MLKIALKYGTNMREVEDTLYELYPGISSKVLIEFAYEDGIITQDEYLRLKGIVR